MSVSKQPSHKKLLLRTQLSSLRLLPEINSPHNSTGHISSSLPDQDFAETLKTRALFTKHNHHFSAFAVSHAGLVTEFTSVLKLIDHLELQAKNTNTVPLWVDIETSSLQDLEIIANYLDIHALTLRTCLRSNARQKLEVFPNYFFLVLDTMHHHHYCPDQLNLINIIYFPQMVLTVHQLPAFVIDIAKETMLKVNIFIPFVLFFLTDVRSK
jgi:Mg2+ and Co2+ transporter CorA